MDMASGSTAQNGRCDHLERASGRRPLVGASHAWGGSDEALRSLRRVVRTDGRLVYGDGYWQRPPTPAATALFGEQVPSLDRLAGQAVDAGWTILHSSIADEREWDDFESTWRAGREDWLAMFPNDERADTVRATLARRLHEYMTVYRGTLGFAYLVLA